MKRRTVPNEEGWLLSYADLITNLLIFFVMLLAASDMSRTRMQQIAESLSGVEQPESLSSIQEQIEQKIREEGLEELIRTELDEDGLRISVNSGLVFDSGSAVIRTEQDEVLNSMLGTFVPYAEQYDFAVEGHTDSKPVAQGSIYKSNWELSTDRANAVRARLESIGVTRGNIRVEGYADTVALPEEELTGLSEDERLARHRRVVVRIY
ncbi:MAG: OmpA family protein [Alphaproteobacteria bacterium]|nr:OmpA family protein [Alphaproteobacteria bacterium]